MQTVTYYMLKNAKGEYLDEYGDPTMHPEVGRGWCSGQAAVACKASSHPDFRVVKVTRTIKQRTYSRAWAVKQVLKGKHVRTDRDEAGCYIKLGQGFEWFDGENDYIGDACFFHADGYYLVP